MQNPPLRPPPRKNQPCLGLLHPPPRSQTSKKSPNLHIHTSKERMTVNAHPKPKHPQANLGSGKMKGAQRSHGGGGCRAVLTLVLFPSGLRQERVTQAEGVSRTEKNARLCSWPGLWRLPLSLSQKFPRAWRRSMLASRQQLAGRPARKAQICRISSTAQGRSPADCPPAGAARPESLRTTLPVRARAGEREAGTRALFIGAQRPGLWLPAQPSSSRERGTRSPITQAKQLPPGV